MAEMQKAPGGMPQWQAVRREPEYFKGVMSERQHYSYVGRNIFPMWVGLECVAERNLYVEGVDLSLFTALILVAVCGDEVGTYLHAKIVLLVVAAYTDVPSHLEAIPCVVLADCIFTFTVIEYIDPLAGFFLTVGIAIFFFILLGEMELEIKTYIGIKRYSVSDVEAIYVVHRNLKIDILVFGLELVAFEFIRFVSKEEIYVGAGFNEHVLGNSKAMDVVEAESIETYSLAFITSVFLVETEVGVVIRHSYAVVALCTGNRYAGNEKCRSKKYLFHNVDNLVSNKDFI